MRTKTVPLADSKEIVIREITAAKWWEINKKTRSFTEGKWVQDDAELQRLLTLESAGKEAADLSVPDLLVVTKEVQELNFPAAIAKKLLEQSPQESPEM